MNFDGVSNFDISCIEIKSHYNLSCKIWKRLEGVSFSALSFVAEFGQAILGVP
jgi:hypothetical protein